MTDITHTPYTTKPRRAGSIMFCILSSYDTDTLEPDCHPSHWTGRAKRTKEQNQHTKTNCTFFKCKRTTWKFVNILFVVWFE